MENKIINLDKILPEGFAQNDRNKGKIFLTRAMEYLREEKGWVEYKIGNTRRNGKILPTGIVCQMEEGSPFWVILNVKNDKGRFVDMLHYTGVLTSVRGRNIKELNNPTIKESLAIHEAQTREERARKVEDNKRQKELEKENLAIEAAKLAGQCRKRLLARK